MTLLTEKEAAEKWCPMARLFDSGGVHNRTRLSHDKGGPGPAGTQCIGSRCMAWRVANSGYERNGYCGAFGKVEP